MRFFVFLLAVALSHAAPAQADLRAELHAAFAAAQPYTNIRDAKRAGWRPFGGEAPLMGRHYSHPDGPDYKTGDRIDFSRPSNLLYATIGGKTALVALAYVVRQKPGDPLPQGFSGGRDIWHVHDGDRILSAVQETRPVIGSMIDRFLTQRIIHNDGHTQLSMVHLWLIPNPKGRFASHNPRLAYLDLGLPPDRADDMSIARGLALARREGCDEALDAELWLSGAPRRVVRGIMAECRKAADRVRAARADGPLSVEAEAARQYRRVEDAVQISLTPAEQRRMTAFVEDGPGICR
ncbi:MAG: hypothetical protein AAF230_02885 [Pseudomonadota bacterium]